MRVPEGPLPFPKRHDIDGGVIKGDPEKWISSRRLGTTKAKV